MCAASYNYLENQGLGETNILFKHFEIIAQLLWKKIRIPWLEISHFSLTHI